MPGDARRPARPFPLLAALSGVPALLWLIALCGVWIGIAGQAGSPRPDDWDRLALMLVGLTQLAGFAELPTHG